MQEAMWPSRDIHILTVTQGLIMMQAMISFIVCNLSVGKYVLVVIEFKGADVGVRTDFSMFTLTDSEERRQSII